MKKTKRLYKLVSCYPVNTGCNRITMKVPYQSTIKCMTSDPPHPTTSCSNKTSLLAHLLFFSIKATSVLVTIQLIISIASLIFVVSIIVLLITFVPVSLLIYCFTPNICQKMRGNKISIQNIKIINLYSSKKCQVFSYLSTNRGIHTHTC